MNLKQLRESVPTISENGPIYLDNACVTLRPQPGHRCNQPLLH